MLILFLSCFQSVDRIWMKCLRFNKLISGTSQLYSSCLAVHIVSQVFRYISYFIFIFLELIGGNMTTKETERVLRWGKTPYFVSVLIIWDGSWYETNLCDTCCGVPCVQVYLAVDCNHLPCLSNVVGWLQNLMSNYISMIVSVKLIDKPGNWQS